MGSNRQGVPLRDRRGRCVARRSLQRTLAAPRLSFHVRARVHGRVSVLLGDRGRLRWLRCPPRKSRRHPFGSIAGAAREAAGVQAADGLELPLGVVVWKRLQLRLSGGVHQGAAAVGKSSSTTSARWTCGRQRQIGGGRLLPCALLVCSGKASGRELKPSPPTTEPCSAAVVVALPVPASSRMAHGRHQQSA